MPSMRAVVSENATMQVLLFAANELIALVRNVA